jgi:hypothetical protein
MNTEQLEKEIKCCIGGHCVVCPRQPSKYPKGIADCKDLLYDQIRAALRAQQEKENAEYYIEAIGSEAKHIFDLLKAEQEQERPLTLPGVKKRQGLPIFCAKSDLYGVVGFRRTPREDFCVGFWYGWEWLEDVWKANEGQIYANEPTQATQSDDITKDKQP